MLHLLGVRVKNYRNFKDTFIPLSSKYDVICEDEVQQIELNVLYQDEPQPIKTDVICPDEVQQIKYDHKFNFYKQIIIKKIEITSLDKNLSDDISYVCLIGKNGTGKTTALSYETDYVYSDEAVPISQESINYRVYIDEDTNEVIIAHNYKFKYNPLGTSLTDISNCNTTLDGEKINIIESNHRIENFYKLYEIRLDGDEIYVDKKNSNADRGNLNNYTVDQKNVIEILKIDNENIAFEFSFFAFDIYKDNLSDDFNEYKKNLYTKVRRDVIDPIKIETLKDTFNEYAKLVLYAGKTSIIDEEEIMNGLNYETLIPNKEEKILFEKIINTFAEICYIDNNDLVYVTRNNLIVEKIFRFFINYKNKEDENYKLLMGLLDDIYEFKNKYNSEIFESRLINTSNGETQSINILAKLNNKIDQVINEIPQNANNTTAIMITIDEPDIHMHPEWARRFKYLLDRMLKEKLKKNKNIKFQIIITTHSPFIVSDFKKNEVVFLDYIKHEIDKRSHSEAKRSDQSFYGANIYDIMKDGFFMDSPIGEFARKEISEAIKDLKKDEDIDLDNIIKLKDEISDKFLKDYLNTLISNYELRKKA